MCCAVPSHSVVNVPQLSMPLLMNPWVVSVWSYHRIAVFIFSVFNFCWIHVTSLGIFNEVESLDNRVFRCLIFMDITKVFQRGWPLALSNASLFLVQLLHFCLILNSKFVCCLWLPRVWLHRYTYTLILHNIRYSRHFPLGEKKVWKPTSIPPVPKMFGLFPLRSSLSSNVGS